MRASLVTDAVLSLIPGWYRCKGGKLPLKLAVEESATTFFAVRDLTPEMCKLKEHAEKHANLLRDFVSSFPPPIAVDLIQEFLALKWLDLTNQSIKWEKVLAYFRELSERTYENATITKNVILTPNESGTFDITESKYAKIFDILASSPQCFIKTDGQMRFVGYDEIRWKSIKDTEQSKFHPEFLQPFYCALGEGEFSIHHTSKRDLIVMGHAGIIATTRKNRWKLYDCSNLKESLGDILYGERQLGCSLCEILLDLSFQRHGALLIFDPSDKLTDQVVNPHAWIVADEAKTGSAHSILRDRIREIKPTALRRASKGTNACFGNSHRWMEHLYFHNPRSRPSGQ